MLHNYKVLGLNKKSALLFEHKLNEICKNPYSKLFFHSSISEYDLIDYDLLCTEQIWHDLNYFLVCNCFYADFYCCDTDIYSTNT